MKKTKANSINTTFQLKVKTVIGLIIGIVIILVAVYFLTTYIVKNNRKGNFTPADARIQYDVILAGESFDQSENEYLVLYYDQDNIGMYSEVLSKYFEDKTKLKLYKCYTDEALNKNLIGTEINKDITEADKLKVHDQLLIHYKNGKIIDYVKGKEEIEGYLQ